jgi:hypothetical protein
MSLNLWGAKPEIDLQIPFLRILYYHYGMRIKVSLAKGVLLAFGIALIPVTAAAAENVTPSSACKVWNQKVVSQDKTYTCMKSGKKLIWSKGSVVKPTLTSSSTSTPADAPVAALTNTPSTTSALETESTGPTCSRNKNALRNC